MFCYETTRISVNTNKVDASFDPLRCDATKCYLDHHKNLLTLDWFSKHGSMAERAQANAELEICRRKMAYWRRQPHFNQDRANAEMQKLNRTARQ